MRRCFVTGATGFIGRFLVAKLLSSGCSVDVLVRHPNSASSSQILDKWRQSNTDGSALLRSSLNVIEGDFSNDEAFKGVESFSHYDDVFHLAALYDLASSSELNDQINVGGTESLMNRLVTDDFCGRVHFVSSIAVAGDYDGVFNERMFDEGQTFSHPYHQSKYESERCVRKFRAEHNLDVRIYRPSAVVGHSQTGEMDKVDGFYYLFILASVLRRWLPPWYPLVLPKLEGCLDVVPVDYVVDAMLSLSLRPVTNDNFCYHLTNPSSPPLHKAFDLVLQSAEAPSVKLKLPLARFGRMASGFNQLSLLKQLKLPQLFIETLLGKLGLPKTVFAAMMPDVRFDAETTLALLGEDNIVPPKLESYVDVLWDFYNRHLDPQKNRERLAVRAFKGKTVLISGGSAGIGYESAKCALSYGATVILIARDSQKLEESRESLRQFACSDDQLDAYACDLSNLDECDQLLTKLFKKYPTIDIFFSNAGRSIRRSISKSEGRFHDLERTMQLNYFGAARLMLGILPKMLASGGGHILHSSSMGTLAPTPRFGPYMASKAATDALMDSLAAEYANQGIVLTSIKFPLVKTGMVAPTSDYDKDKLVRPEVAARMFVDAVIDQPRVQSTSLGVLLGSLSLFTPSMITAIYNYLYQIWPDDKHEFPEMEMDRALITSFVKGSPL